MSREAQAALAAQLFPVTVKAFEGRPCGFDPLNDLNISHELQKYFNGEEWDRYWDVLAAVCGGYRYIICATAQERLEGILRVRRQI